VTHDDIQSRTILFVVTFVMSTLYLPLSYDILYLSSSYTNSVVNFISFWGSFLSSLLLLPFACVGLLIMAAVYCFVAGFSFLLKLTRSRRRSTELSEVDVPTRRRLSNSNRNPNTALRDLSSIIDRMEEGRPSS